MTSTKPATQHTGFAANEPVVVSAGVAWLFSLLGTYLIGHTDLVTSGTWSALTTVLVPIIAGLVLTGLAWVTRRVVTPAWKFVSTETQKVGIPNELLIQLVEGGVVRELNNLKTRYPQYEAVINQILNEKAKTGA